MNAPLLAHAAPHYWSALLLAALISAAVSIVGYWQNARAKRLDRQRQLFADAFRSVTEYREFVYKVRRRSPNASRNQVTDALSDVQAQLNLHMATLEIEAPYVAEHYVTLVNETRRVVGPQISRAWEQSPTTSDADMQTQGIDTSELGQFETAYIRACNRHLHRVLRSGMHSRSRDRRHSTEQPEDVAQQDSIYEICIDDSSTWKLMTTLFSKTGLVIMIASIALGIWLSTSHMDSLSSALGDMITPAAVMISSAIAIAVWIAGPQRHPRRGQRVAKPDDLLGMAWIFSCAAIVGIGLAVTFRTLSPSAPTGILELVGSLALALMGLVLIGLTRLLLFSLRSISRRLPESQKTN